MSFEFDPNNPDPLAAVKQIPPLKVKDSNPVPMRSPAPGKSRLFSTTLRVLPTASLVIGTAGIAIGVLLFSFGSRFDGLASFDVIAGACNYAAAGALWYSGDMKRREQQAAKPNTL